MTGKTRDVLMSYNVVFITSDQHRRDACGCYGNAIVQTPNLDALAARGVRFTQAYCDSPLCAPSRASYISGRHVHNHGALTHAINGRSPGTPGNGGIESSETLGTMFRKAGYATAAIGKLHVHGETRENDLGFDVRAHRFYTYDYEDYIAAVGEDRVEAYLSGKDRDDELKYNTALAPVELAEPLMQDSLTTATSIDFIQRHTDRPFFIHVGLEKPHPPWTTQPRFLDLYDPDLVPLPESRHEWWEKAEPRFPFMTGKGFNCDRDRPYSDAKMRNAIAAYYACISEMDGNVGRILDAIEAAGLTDRTVVIYSADHGDNLFEHGLEQKHCFYEGPVGVPLIVAVPEGFPRGTESAQLTSLIDIMPTLAALTGLPVPADADGVSLVPAMRGEVDLNRAVFSEFYEWRDWPGQMIRYRNWKYILYRGHSELLFDLAQDPHEMENLVDDPGYAAIRDALRERVLDGWTV
ncbi:MAG: sulfatase-like hydrolase/transferase [Anaerolineae bacterium]|nr:sulfatase-like hydrolase/transferase [Anaerolineae bacterium]